jgi:aryl-alcohol dehydrogenase-like predicted oxidoreductase
MKTQADAVVTRGSGRLDILDGWRLRQRGGREDQSVHDGFSSIGHSWNGAKSATRISWFSAVGLGCNNLALRCDYEQSRAVVDQALASGITLFDTADAYGNRGGSEEFLGRILGTATRRRGDRDQVRPAHGRCRTAQGGVATIRDDGRRVEPQTAETDWIDLYQLHWPDPATPIEETLRALDDLGPSGEGSATSVLRTSPLTR